jgi:hypothetical protein
METIGILNRVLKPPVLAWLALTALTVVFMAGYFVIGYQSYLKDFNTTQLEETKAVHKKIETALRQLNDLLDLSTSLIKTASSTSANTQQGARIQEILKSVTSLKLSSNLPSLQKVVFTNSPHLNF